MVDAPEDRTLALNIVWLEDDTTFYEAAKNLLDGPPPEPGLELRPTIHRTITLAETLAALRDDLPGLIITDLNVADSHGSDTLLAIRRVAPETPLLVLSGTAEVDAPMATAVENAEFMDKDEITSQRLWRTLYMAIMRSSAHPAPW